MGVTMRTTGCLKQPGRDREGIPGSLQIQALTNRAIFLYNRDELRVSPARVWPFSFWA